jgi:hypothetical protein
VGKWINHIWKVFNVLEKDGDQLVRGRKVVVLHRVKAGRNILSTINRRKAIWIGHMLSRNCLLKHVSERNI